MLDQFTRKEGEGEEERTSGGSSVSRIGDGERESEQRWKIALLLHALPKQMMNSLPINCPMEVNETRVHFP